MFLLWPVLQGRRAVANMQQSEHTNLSCDWSIRFMKVILLSLVRTSLQYRCTQNGLQYKCTAVQLIQA